MVVPLVAALATMLAGAPGCETRLSLGARCERAADCAAPLSCGPSGRCSEACVTSRDCPALLHCVRDPAAPDPSSAIRTCALEPNECGSDARSCPRGLVCLDARCVNECIIGDECPDGICRSGSCVAAIAALDAGAEDASDASTPVDAPEPVDGPEPGDAPDAAMVDAPWPTDAMLLPDSPDAPALDAALADGGGPGGSVWQAVLLPADGATADYAGSSVALSADGMRAIVGLPYDDTPAGLDAGSARVFVRAGATWSMEATLVAADGAPDDRFGCAVALTADGTRAIVGAYFDDMMSSMNTGSARVFTRTAGAWTAEATLSLASRTALAYFGQSVTLSADGIRALVGAPLDPAGGTLAGSASVFVRTGTTWAAEATLSSTAGATRDLFGQSVALSADGSRAVIGAPHEDSAGADAGSARVFLRSGSAWALEAMLLPADVAAGDFFGHAVALTATGDRAVVGAYGDDGAGGANAGSARVFVRSGTAWASEATLTALDGAAGDNLGYAVALAADGTRALTGAQLDGTAAGAGVGTARLFVRAGTIWEEGPTLVAPDGSANDSFGSSVSLSADGTLALVGAPLDDTTGGTNAGSAHFFSLLP